MGEMPNKILSSMWPSSGGVGVGEIRLQKSEQSSETPSAEG